MLSLATAILWGGLSQPVLSFENFDGFTTYALPFPYFLFEMWNDASLDECSGKCNITSDQFYTIFPFNVTTVDEVKHKLVKS